MIIGIDLGTTNSAVGIWRNGKAELIPNQLGNLLTPSAVSIDENGTVSTGLAARQRVSIDPDNTATLFKRYMGTNHKFSLRNQYYSAEELSSLVIESLKKDAELYLGEEINKAVITVPAYFNQKQRRATKKAGELAGLQIERLVNEPTAGALAYGIHKYEYERPFLVFDLGGGTFDVSLVEIFDGIIEVRASAGDNRLGGEDFNHIIIEIAIQKLDGQFDDYKKTTGLFPILLESAERARRHLTTHPKADFEFVWKNEQYSVPIDRTEFSEAAQPLIAKFREPILRSLRDSNTKLSEINDIIMIGGSTRMPLIRDAVTLMFGRFPHHHIDPDHAVALGAAIQAGLKSNDEDLEEIRLTDVAPFSLGVGSGIYDENGQNRKTIFSPIIERNTVIPASRVNRYVTSYDNQKLVEFSIYQGESIDIDQNVKLGTLSIDVPPRKRGKVGIDCRFTYDSSGLLEVDITELETNQTKQLLIFDQDDQDSIDNFDLCRAKLAKLKIHPRDEAENKAAMARSERCYESFIGDNRNRIVQCITAFETALATQDRRIIEQARNELNRDLDMIEGETYL